MKSKEEVEEAEEERGYIWVTATMVRDAVEELEKQRERVPMALLVSHLKRRLPVLQGNDELLRRQLLRRIDEAVQLGWLRRYSDDSYALSDLRWQASVQEFGFH